MIHGEMKIGRKITIKVKKSKTFAVGEIWYGLFPLEEDDDQFLPRPIIILDVDIYDVLAIKVTKQEPKDVFDIPINNWLYAGLDVPSYARISKYKFILKRQFDYKKGNLHPDDLEYIKEKFMEYVNSN